MSGEVLDLMITKIAVYCSGDDIKSGVLNE